MWRSRTLNKIPESRDLGLREEFRVSLGEGHWHSFAFICPLSPTCVSMININFRKNLPDHEAYSVPWLWWHHDICTCSFTSLHSSCEMCFLLNWCIWTGSKGVFVIWHRWTYMYIMSAMTCHIPSMLLPLGLIGNVFCHAAGIFGI